MVAKREVDGESWFSLGSNPDVTLDLLPMIEEARRQGRPMVTVAQVNREMPFMYNDAMIRPAAFDLVLDHPGYDFRLFGAPNMPVDNADYLLGLAGQRPDSRRRYPADRYRLPGRCHRAFLPDCGSSRTRFTSNCWPICASWSAMAI